MCNTQYQRCQGGTESDKRDRLRDMSNRGDSLRDVGLWGRGGGGGSRGRWGGGGDV